MGVAVSLVTALAGAELHRVQAADRAGFVSTAAGARALLADAQRQGYSRDDLAPLARAIATGAPSAWTLPWQGPLAYRASATTLASAMARVPVLEAAALGRHREAAGARLAAALAEVDAAAAHGADATELDAVRAELARANAALPSAADPLAVDALGARAVGLGASAKSAGDVAQAELARLQAAAAGLKSQYQGNLDQLRSAGATGVAAGRNDATVAALLKMTPANHLASRLEHYAAMLASPDVDQVALGVAGVQSYSQGTRDALLGHLPHKTLVASLSAQQLWAYEDGRLVKDTLITTGRPELPTDIGVMHVLSKDTPWKMHSPWPKGSPYWYPDTTVRKVVWFTVTGEGLHDAAWQPVSTYGPGGQFTASASHGCIHLPDAAEDFVFDWADAGATVIVYPGDGAPVADQLKQVSVDAAGVPLTGPKGS